MTEILSHATCCNRDLDAMLIARIHDAQSALRQSTDADRDVARSMLRSALRDFTEIIFSHPSSCMGGLSPAAMQAYAPRTDIFRQRKTVCSATLGERVAVFAT
jgi:hypothetical protein